MIDLVNDFVYCLNCIIFGFFILLVCYVVVCVDQEVCWFVLVLVVLFGVGVQEIVLLVGDVYYMLCLLCSGYVYVYKEVCDEWLVWQVNEYGDLFVFDICDVYLLLQSDDVLVCCLWYGSMLFVKCIVVLDVVFGVVLWLVFSIVLWMLWVWWWYWDVIYWVCIM